MFEVSLVFCTLLGPEGPAGTLRRKMWGATDLWAVASFCWGGVSDLGVTCFGAAQEVPPVF